MAKNNKLKCSLVTKNKLGNSLKELMEKESFEKISVSDITDNCDFHRQTFYYHFSDKYELLEWVIYNDVVEPLITDFVLEDIGDRFYRMFKTMANNKRFYQNAIKINLNELSRYISKAASDKFLDIVCQIDRGNKLSSSDEETQLLAEFLGYGIVGIVFGWIHRGLKDSPEVMAARIVNIMNSSRKLVDK